MTDAFEIGWDCYAIGSVGIDGEILIVRELTYFEFHQTAFSGVRPKASSMRA